MQTAQFRAMLNMEDTLEFAYQSWRRGFDDPDIHLAFAAVFLNRDTSNPINGYPDQVSTGDVVDLRINGKVNSYVIVENNETPLNPNEIRSENDLAKRILGSKKGDIGVLKENSLERIEYEVINIRKKYVYAFQEVFSNFTTRFPNHKALHKVKINDNDFGVIFRMLDDRQKVFSAALDIYREMKLPVSTLALSLGVSRVKAWVGMIGISNGRLIAS